MTVVYAKPSSATTAARSGKLAPVRCGRKDNCWLKLIVVLLVRIQVYKSIRWPCSRLSNAYKRRMNATTMARGRNITPAAVLEKIVRTVEITYLTSTTSVRTAISLRVLAVASTFCKVGLVGISRRIGKCWHWWRELTCILADPDDGLATSVTWERMQILTEDLYATIMSALRHVEGRPI